MKYFFIQKIWNELYISVVLFVSYFLPIKEWLAVIILAVFTDFVTGLAAAVKNKQPIKSRRLADTVLKIISYLLSIMLAFVIEKNLQMDLPAVKIVGALIISVELKSVDENFQVITGISIFNSIVKVFKKKEGN